MTYRPLGIEDKMPFGKYKGQKIRVVLFEDISYMQWLLDTNMDFKLDDVANKIFERLVANV